MSIYSWKSSKPDGPHGETHWTRGPFRIEPCGSTSTGVSARWHAFEDDRPVTQTGSRTGKVTQITWGTVRDAKRYCDRKLVESGLIARPVVNGVEYWIASDDRKSIQVLHARFVEKPQYISAVDTYGYKDPYAVEARAFQNALLGTGVHVQNIFRTSFGPHCIARTERGALELYRMHQHKRIEAAKKELQNASEQNNLAVEALDRLHRIGK